MSLAETPAGEPLPCRLRTQATPADRNAVRSILASTGFFYPGEIDIAVELVDEHLAKGDASGYHFVFADSAAGDVLGYACYGQIPCTLASYDLYWIAVDQHHHSRGLGRMLLDEVERQVKAAGGQQLYIETSNREQYQPTRHFYLRCGYQQAALLADFYAPGDDKVIYAKRLVG